jgi:hypothetical protein
VTFVFGRFLGQDVTFEGLTALDSTTWTNSKALFSAAFGLHFGHENAPSCSHVVLVRRLRTKRNLVGPETLLGFCVTF